MTYQQRYYREHLDYFQWYRNKHRARTNARKRERYRTDQDYRQRDIERSKEYYRNHKQKKETETP